MWWVLVGFFTGRSLRNAGLPDSEKQRRFDEAQARRARRQATQTMTTGQWVIVVVFLLIVLSLAIQAYDAVFG